MSIRTMIRSGRLIPILFVLGLNGCATWRPATLGPQDLVANEHPTQVRVTRTDGSIVVGNAPRFHGDTLSGLTPQAQAVNLPVRDIQRLDTRVTDPALTVAAVGVTVGAAVALAVVLGSSGSGY